MIIDHNIFTTAFILDTLDCVDTSAANAIKRTCVNVLLQKTSADGTYTYSPEYPADLDDTSCTLAALYKYDKNLLTGTSTGKFVNALITCETAPGGPYNTWITRDIRWKDTDLAVNINVAYILKLLQVSTPALDNLIDDAIRRDKFNSKYYAAESIVIYFISRFYEGAKKTTLITNILNRLNKSKSNDQNFLDRLLLVNALLNLKCNVVKVKENSKILIEVYKSLAHITFPFIIEKTSSTNTKYYGSTNITQTLMTRLLASLPAQIETPTTHADDDKIVKSVIKRYNKLTNYYKCENIVSTKLIREVILQPYHFAKSISPTATIANRTLFVTLGLANVCGWIAYTIYDHLADNELVGHAAYNLSIANKCLLKLTQIYTQRQVPKFITNKYFYFSDVMANAFCISNMQTDNLYQFSCGYILAPLYVWYKFSNTGDHKLETNLINFYKNYLNARQIIDNIHDWKYDQETQEKRTRYTAPTNNTTQKPTYINTTKNDFWNIKAPELLKAATNNVNHAKNQLPYLGYNTYLTQTLSVLESTISDTKTTITKTNELIKTLHCSSL